MNILVTGGAGFIGSHLVDKFLADNHRVCVIDNLSTGSKKNIQHHYNNKNFSFMEEDIANMDSKNELCRTIDLILHLASSVGVKYIMNNPVKSLNSNVLSSISIIKSAAEMKKKIIVFSTSEIYGQNNSKYLRESDKRIMNSSFRWSYSVGKSIAEYYAIAYGKEMDLDYTILRCFNIVGPRQTGDYGMVLPRLILQALKNEPMTVYDDGNQIRTFTYVGDVVNIISNIIKKNNSKQQIYNIGSYNSISILNLAKKIKLATSSHSPIVFIPSKKVYGRDFKDIKTRIPNIEKIKMLINNYEFLNIDSIIMKTIACLQESI